MHSCFSLFSCKEKRKTTDDFFLEKQSLELTILRYFENAKWLFQEKGNLNEQENSSIDEEFYSGGCSPPNPSVFSGIDYLGHNAAIIYSICKLLKPSFFKVFFRPLL